MLRILHEDADIVVVDKPSGMIVHPAPGRREKALSDELVRRYPDMRGVGSVERSGVVHRLDVDTSGVMVFARNRASYLRLRREFESHGGVDKTYLAVVHGRPAKSSGTVETQIGKRPEDARGRCRRTDGGYPLADAFEPGSAFSCRVQDRDRTHPSDTRPFGIPRLSRRRRQAVRRRSERFASPPTSGAAPAACVRAFISASVRRQEGFIYGRGSGGDRLCLNTAHICWT